MCKIIETKRLGNVESGNRNKGKMQVIIPKMTESTLTTALFKMLKAVKEIKINMQVHNDKESNVRLQR